MRFATIILTITLDLAETAEAHTVGPRKFTVRAEDPYHFEDDLAEATHVFYSDPDFERFVSGLGDKYAQEYLERHLCATATVTLEHAGGVRRDVAIGNPFASDFADDLARAVRTLWRTMHPKTDSPRRRDERPADWTHALMAGVAGYIIGRSAGREPANPCCGPEPDLYGRGRLQRACIHEWKRAGEDGAGVQCCKCGYVVADGLTRPLVGDGEPTRKVKCGQCDGHGCPCCDGTGEHEFGAVCSAARRDDRQGNLDRAALAAERERLGLYLVRGNLDGSVG